MTAVGDLFRRATRQPGEPANPVKDAIDAFGGGGGGRSKLAQKITGIRKRPKNMTKEERTKYNSAMRSIQRQTTETAAQKRKPSKKVEEKYTEIRKKELKKEAKKIVKKRQLIVELRGAEYKVKDYPSKTAGLIRQPITKRKFNSLLLQGNEQAFADYAFWKWWGIEPKKGGAKEVEFLGYGSVEVVAE